MTAIDGLDRLESPALWRPGAGQQRRDVYVAIGNAELVIQDSNGAALSHWSLPALVRRNPGETPALYGPATDDDEELEIEETAMIAALDRVMTAVEKGRQRPGALRRLIVGLVAGFLVGVALIWLPGTLRRQAENFMPVAQRAEVGDRMLGELTLLTGAPCGTAIGNEALSILRQRILPTTPIRLTVLRNLPQPAMALPGGTIAISDSVLITQDDPDVAAGHVLAAAISARQQAPLSRFLEQMGFIDLLRLLMKGQITDRSITEHVEDLLLAPESSLSAEILRPGFDMARLAWGPYATAVGLPRGDVPPSRMPPALDDPSWQALREICNG